MIIRCKKCKIEFVQVNGKRFCGSHSNEKRTKIYPNHHKDFFDYLSVERRNYHDPYYQYLRSIHSEYLNSAKRSINPDP